MRRADKAKAAPAPTNDKPQVPRKEGLANRLMREAAKEKMKLDKRKAVEIDEATELVNLFKLALGGVPSEEEKRKDAVRKIDSGGQAGWWLS